MRLPHQVFLRIIFVALVIIVEIVLGSLGMQILNGLIWLCIVEMAHRLLWIKFMLVFGSYSLRCFSSNTLHWRSLQIWCLRLCVEPHLTVVTTLSIGGAYFRFHRTILVCRNITSISIKIRHQLRLGLIWSSYGPLWRLSHVIKLNVGYPLFWSILS